MSVSTAEISPTGSLLRKEYAGAQSELPDLGSLLFDGFAFTSLEGVGLSPFEDDSPEGPDSPAPLPFRG